MISEESKKILKEPTVAAKAMTGRSPYNNPDTGAYPGGGCCSGEGACHERAACRGNGSSPADRVHDGSAAYGEPVGYSDHEDYHGSGAYAGMGGYPGSGVYHDHDEYYVPGGHNSDGDYPGPGGNNGSGEYPDMRDYPGPGGHNGPGEYPDMRDYPGPDGRGGPGGYPDMRDYPGPDGRGGPGGYPDVRDYPGPDGRGGPGGYPDVRDYPGPDMDEEYEEEPEEESAAELAEKLEGKSSDRSSDKASSGRASEKLADRPSEKHPDVSDEDNGDGTLASGDESTAEEPQEKPDYVAEIVKVISSNASPRYLRDKLSDYHDNDISDALLKLTPALRKKVYRVLDVELLSDIFEYSEEDEVVEFLSEMDLMKAARVLEKMDPDIAIDVFRATERNKRAILLELVNDDFRKDVALLASFDEDEIGSRMTTNYIVIHDGLTIKEAMNELITQAPENDNISTLFVLDDNDIFCGAIDLKELIIARRSTPLEDLIMTSYPYVYGTEDIDDCIEKLKDYSENLIPVLDNQNKLLGVITSQSVIEVVGEEMGEDYARLAGLIAEEELEEPLKESMKKRLPWLAVLMLLGLIVSSVVGAFEQVVAELTVVMFFQSMILGMSGNSGTQSLAVTIRILTDEGLTSKQKRQHFFKELRVGFCNGLILGLGSTVCVGLYAMLIKGLAPQMAFAISSCVGVSLLVAMTIAVCVGVLIPMFFKKINIDPAVASGPLITTVTDLISVITYYSLAWILLINTLGY